MLVHRILLINVPFLSIYRGTSADQYGTHDIRGNPHLEGYPHLEDYHDTSGYYDLEGE